MKLSQVRSNVPEISDKKKNKTLPQTHTHTNKVVKLRNLKKAGLYKLKKWVE